MKRWMKAQRLTQDTSSTDIPESILAFRKITSMLSQLPRAIPIVIIDRLEDQSINAIDRQMLKISDALAHITVGEHNIAALAANRTARGHIKVDQLATDVGDPSAAPSLPNSKEEKGSILFSWTQNPDWVTRNTPTPLPCVPTICDPLKPKDLGKRSAYEYVVYLEENW